MSTEPAPATPAPTPDPQPAAAPATPPKKAGLLRPSAIILLLILIVGAVISVPFVIEPWIANKIRGAATSLGLELDPATVIEVKLLRGRVHLSAVKLSETYQGVTRTVLKADEIDIDLAVAACLGGDVVIDRLAATGLEGDLRRRADGTVPLLTPKDDTSGTDWGKLDWWGYAQKGYDWWEKHQAEERQKAEEEAKKPPEQRTPPSAEPVPPEDTRFKEAKRYTPPPAAPGRGPRFLIRVLDISGKGLGLPDDSPFDVTGFTLAGSNVCLAQLPDETMTLTGAFTTKTAGVVNLDVARKPGNTGTLKLSGTGVPIQALADPKISGDALARYQPTGTTDLAINADWVEGALTGLIDSTVRQLTITAPPGDQTAQQVQMVVSRMKDQPLRWPVKIGGTLGRPTITDTGVDELLKGSVTDAAKAAAADEAKRQAEKLIEEQGKKNPQVQEATDQLRGLLPGQKKK